MTFVPFSDLAQFKIGTLYSSARKYLKVQLRYRYWERYQVILNLIRMVVQYQYFYVVPVPVPVLEYNPVRSYQRATLTVA